MRDSLRLRSLLILGVSSAALLATTAAFAQNSPAIGDIVVTAQRKSEAIQDVPVAVSAFSQDTLKAERLDGGDKLELSVPNVNFSRGNFGGYNFQIRGIGTKLVTSSGDAGVSFNENQLPEGANHLADTDFYDVERVEVLRGPQGTLYGRSATGGAVNIITGKPNDRFSGSVTGEYGNFNTYKLSGYINLPIGDTLAVRFAGFGLKRDGFGTNSVTGDKVDNRDLGSWRATVSWKPTDNFRTSLMFENFNENDHRNRVGKQLCIRDPGKTTFNGFAVDPSAQNLLSQGCQPGSLYQAAAYSTVNSGATLGGVLARIIGLTSGDVLATHGLQNNNLHDIESAIDPVNQAKQNVILWNGQWDLTNTLTLDALAGYNRNTGYTAEDYNRLVPLTPFNSAPDPTNAIAPAIASGYLNAITGGNPSSATPAQKAAAAAYGAGVYGAVYAGLFPGGVVNDPQVGKSNKFRSFDYGDARTTEKTAELRLSSSFKGPFNFSAGAIYVDTHTFTNYYVESNGLTAYAQVQNALGSSIFVDPAYPPTGAGHNYYDSRFSGGLKSTGVFGEAYYNLSDSLKLTLGLRQTHDRKQRLFYPIELLATGTGFPATLRQDFVTFNATTGRALLEWKPKLDFTNQTLVYASYSRGYKGGGFNTPSNPAGAYPDTFAPEYIDAYEFGTKNVLMNGAMVMNLTGFFYDYSGYQISQIINKSSVNSNIDAEIYGFEVESLYSPIRNLTFNANVGYLHTKVKSGSILDTLDLTQGNAALTTVNGGSIPNCVVNTAGLTTLIAVTGGAPGTTLLGVCSGGIPAATANAIGLYNYTGVSNLVTATSGGQTIGQGISVNLQGRKLPNSPDFTVAIGAQYVVRFTGDWQATGRIDYYWQDKSYARLFNTVGDQLNSWDNVNATLTFDNRPSKLNVQFFVKNLFDKQPLTDSYLTDQSSGLFRNVFTLDPRTYGVSVTKKF